ncbi:MAG TPA: hypothetical protein VFH99_00520 [Candidatus Saccharimonadales bacterium]|nr:hypothetical protein [Candidatus Saccharimonadales bacterium]
MIKHNQDGAASGLAVSLVLAIVLLVGAIAFGVWSFSGRQDYKNHTDAKIAAAVTVAKQQEGTAKDKQFAEEEKNPLKAYSGPQAYGSIILQYPKTWSGYVADSSSSDNNSTTPVDGYFHPGVVPSITDQASVFSLRLQVLSQSYSQTLTDLNSAQQSQNPPTVKPYALPKVPNTVGVELTGTLPESSNGNDKKTGTMVILPLRSQTLELWTEGDQYTADFNNYILPNFTFSP